MNKLPNCEEPLCLVLSKAMEAKKMEYEEKLDTRRTPEQIEEQMRIVMEQHPDFSEVQAVEYRYNLKP